MMGEEAIDMQEASALSLVNVCLSVCLVVCLSVCLFVCLSVVGLSVWKVD